MSGQARRSRVLAAQRWREQVATAIVQASVRFSPRLPSERAARAKAVANVLDGLGFNVHLAREYGERLIAEARHAGVHAVVDDWRRGQGREPVEHRAVEKCRRCNGVGYWYAGPDGERDCYDCEGAGWLDRKRAIWCDPPGLPPSVPGSALSWQASVRLGHRLLAALEGQPSECQRCGGHGSLNRLRFGRPDACPDCHGTGHSLHGVLPPVEWSPAIMRKVLDAGAHMTDGVTSWQLSIWDPNWPAHATRVGSRGEHRDESRIGERGWVPSSTSRGRIRTARPLAMPRWRRGELKHAEQRRERAVEEQHDRYWEAQRRGWQAGLGHVGQVANVDAPAARRRRPREAAP